MPPLGYKVGGPDVGNPHGTDHFKLPLHALGRYEGPYLARQPLLKFSQLVSIGPERAYTPFVYIRYEVFPVVEDVQMYFVLKSTISSQIPAKLDAELSGAVPNGFE